MKVIGLDLGTASIGWAVVDLAKGEIKGSGARIFPEGVDRDKSKREESKNAKRRLKRQARRQGFRRKMRRKMLANVLISNEMFPQVDGFEKEMQSLRLKAELRAFFHIDPYEKRAAGAEGKKLSLMELGRVFYHIGQRRGFQANLKAADAEDGAMQTGKPEEGKSGINETEEGIKKFRTLGSYLYSLRPSENHSDPRRRNRYTNRDMYQREFDVIWDQQKSHHPEILTDELRSKIGDHKTGILFFQRPLKSQKHTIGKCPFEKKKTRCSKSNILFELLRTHQFINSIRFADSVLSSDQKEIVFELFKTKNNACKFKVIKKKLQLENAKFNYENDYNIPVMKSFASLRKAFGAKDWDAKSLEEQEFIWHIKWQATNREWLENYARDHWNLTDKAIAGLVKFKMADEYAHLSKRAIRQILPWMEKGLEYHTAVVLGGIARAFGADAWADLGESDQNALIVQVDRDILRKKSKEITQKDRLKNYLRDEYGLSRNALNKLYHHSDLRIDLEQRDRLANPPNLRNPIVNSALWEVKRVVNALIEEYGKPDQIRVELARELKSSKQHREDIWRNNLDRENERNAFKIELLEKNIAVNPRNIQKISLWHECQKTCPYTGDSISFNDLFGQQLFEVEHIVPRSRSLNDSYANKTLCHINENSRKGNKTPYETYSGNERTWEEIKARTKKLLPFRKYQHFVKKNRPELEEFISRQLNDTRYISRASSSYLQSICNDVRVVGGGVTAILRRNWGLNSILSPGQKVEGLPDGEYAFGFDKEEQLIAYEAITPSTQKAVVEKMKKNAVVVTGRSKAGKILYDKSRIDHRHHAVDALVIACTQEKFLQEIARRSAGNQDVSTIGDYQHFPLPWEVFRPEAKTAIRNILVSHKQVDRSFSLSRKWVQVKVKGESKWIKGQGMAARGQLHKETVYGRRCDGKGGYYFHIRKSLDELTNAAQVNKIVDDRVRKIVKDHLEKEGYDLSKKYKIKPNTFFDILDNKERVPKLYLPNKNGAPTPIRKVRLRERSSNAVQVREGFNQFVEPGNNHHIEIYQNQEGAYEEEVVSFWQAVERKRQGLSVYGVRSSKDWKLVLTLQQNDLFVMGIEDGVDWKNLPRAELPVYRVQKISSLYYVFRLLSASQLEFESQQIRVSSFKGLIRQNPKKINITVLGTAEGK